jgi:hypothetical protein
MILRANEAVGQVLTKKEFAELLGKEQLVQSDGTLDVEVWPGEEKAGRLLVDVSVDEGVDDVEPLLRDEYEGDDEDEESDEEFDTEGDEESDTDSDYEYD